MGTKLSERKLDDLDFPVLIKICLNPAFNEDKIKEVGYYSLWSYFTGKGRWRNSNGSAVYGWAGHWENGSTISSVKDIQSNISMNIKEILYYINLKFTTRPSEQYYWNEAILAHLKMPNYPNNCHDVDISLLTSNLSGFHQVQFNF